MITKSKTFLAAMAFAAVSTLSTAQADDNVKLTFASFSVGGSWYVYASTIAEILRDVLPETATVDATPLGGGVVNSLLIDADKAQIALSHAMTNKWAVDGAVAYDKPVTTTRALVGGLDTYYLSVTASGAEAGTGLRAYFESVNPEAKLGLNPGGSVATFAGKLMLDAANASEEEVEARGGAYLSMPLGTIKDSFPTGVVDATPQIITRGHPAITEISENNKVTILQPEDDVLEKMKDAYGFDLGILPADSFKGQSKDVKLPVTSTTVIVSENMSDDLAYIITKAIVENADRLAAAHQALANFDPSKGWQPNVVNLPLHPGAEKYYRQRGWIE